MDSEDYLSLELPSYTPSAPLPSYSCTLACGEQRLEHSPRHSASARPPTATFIKNANKVTITLCEQEEGVSTPTYARNAVISGLISLEEPETVLEVAAYVVGKLDTTFSESGGGSVKLLKDRYTLWDHANAGTSASQGSCPSQIPFAFILPATFKHEGQDVPLPPSYHQHFLDVPTLFVKSSYNLHFVIKRVRHQKLGIWNKTKHVLIPFRYYPRTRSYRPILPSPGFFSTVKTSPEEWYQAMTTLKTRSPNIEIKPIISHLFIPAGRIYSVKDTIPFHVQLTGTNCVLKDIFSPFLNKVTSADTVDSAKTRKRPAEKPFVRVYLLRQVCVSMKPARSWKNLVLGEGTISPVPPTRHDTFSDCSIGHVDWEGEVRCNDPEAVGSFQAAHVNIKDFIALSLNPPSDCPVPLLSLNMSVPVRLVTDPYPDVSSMDTSSQD